MPSVRQRTSQHSTSSPKLNLRTVLRKPKDIDSDYIHVDDAIPDADAFVDAVPRLSSSFKPTTMQHQSRRKPLRVDAQDGPWSVSVAENPHDVKTYSIYIQTPTHLLTLTRTASEIADLHGKLVDSCPTVDLPALPLHDVPTKRRSSFLHTLSRLANNNSAKPTSNARSYPQQVPTPAMSPGRERDDPFTTPLSNPSATATSLASYLTFLSNHTGIRATRPWRRFVRVRTDDLESVRVERAVRRVRSDLAMHLPAQPPSEVVPALDSHPVSESESEAQPVNHRESSAAGGATPESTTVDHDSGVGGLQKEGIKEEEEDEEMLSMREDAKIAELVAGGESIDGADAGTPVAELPEPSLCASQVESAETPPTDVETSDDPSESAELPVPGEDTLPTPAPSPPTPSPHPATRIPRSASADPDKATRLSRVWSPDNENLPGSSPRKTKRTSPKSKSKERKVAIDDFEMMRVLGKGCAGKVLLVRHRASTNLYALKAITKRHVLAHQELQHTLTEQAVLKRMAHEARDPFVVKLWWSFHDKENLFLVMDFHPGGDLATQLARWGRLGRDRARFYAAEIVEGVEGLHAAGVIYRDLKPENILIGTDGHIVLTDFGLSKEFPRRSTAGLPLITAPSTPKGGSSHATDSYYSNGTSVTGTPYWMQNGVDTNGPGWAGGTGRDVTGTFCGTAEYLAPEVIQGLQYSYEVDWWSFGTMLYEMLTGITPFWANNHSDMYVRVLQDELQFPDDKAMDQDTKSLIRGLLQRNPALRMSEPRIKRHPYFSMIDWSHVYHKRYIPPYIPPIDPSNASDTQNFDDAFLDMDPVIDNEPEADGQTDSEREKEREESDDASRSPQRMQQEENPDLFDGYSFKGRQSVILDEDADDEDETEEEDEPEPPIVPEEQAVTEPSIPEEVAPIEGTETPTEAKPAPVDEDEREATPVSVAKEVAEQAEEPVSVDEVAPQEPLIPPPKTAMKSADTKQPKAVTIAAPRPPPRRREKSGVPALDRHLSRVEDEDEDAGAVEDDDDWDLVETPGGEDRNGSKATSLFARGVVDRYRLAVFRKSSNTHSNGQPRSFSGVSIESDIGSQDAAQASPSPSDKRRGRSTGLSLRKSTRQFLRARSPPSTVSSGSRTVSRTAIGSATVSSTTGLLTPSPSIPTPANVVSPQSLKSKDSRTSMGSPSGSSDGEGRSLSQSAGEVTTPPSSYTRSGDTAVSENGKRPARASSGEEPGHKLKKMKKYKEGAEKVLSLFGSPRQEKSQTQS